MPNDWLRQLDRKYVTVILNQTTKFYWMGGIKPYQSASEADFALAGKLAFYCGHDINQMYRLFMQSRLRRAKFKSPRPDGSNYALLTLKKAIARTPKKWIKKKRQSRATGAKKGRRISPRTTEAIELHHQEPELSSIEISRRLNMTPRQVRDAIRYHRPEGGKFRHLIHVIYSKGESAGPVQGLPHDSMDEAA